MFLKLNKLLFNSFRNCNKFNLILRNNNILYVNKRKFSVIGNKPQYISIVKDVNFQKYLNKIETEFNNLKTSINNDNNEIHRIQSLSCVIDIIERRTDIHKNLQSLVEFHNETDKELLELAENDKQKYLKQLETLDIQLIEALQTLINEDDDCTSVILEVTAGVGGQEAMIFARELLDMYCGYIMYKNWQSDTIQHDNTELGGIRHASLIVSGDDVLKGLKYEGGVHRVQRIPATERAGRVHTSTVTVAVIPKYNQYEIEIKSKDLRIETKRATGAGGQHVNTTDSAVRIVHLPTGTVVECQTDRSQIKNKEIALIKLKTKLSQQIEDKQTAHKLQSRKSQVGTSNRNEKIRTYNFSQDRITDHRINCGTVHNIEEFLKGTEHFNDLISKVRHNIEYQNLLETIKN